MSHLKSRSAYLSGLVVVGFVFAVALLTTPARADDAPPRPTLEPTATLEPTSMPVPTSAPTQPDQPDEPTPVLYGRIIGTVIDLTTGVPTAGISVAVGDAVVTTDSNGNYERGGLPEGTYIVALQLRAEQGVPAQEPIAIVIAADATIVQHLAFRSQPSVTPTLQPTPTNTPIPTSPTATVAPGTATPAPTAPDRMPSPTSAVPHGSPPGVLPDTSGSSNWWMSAALIFSGLLLGVGLAVRRFTSI